MSDDTTPTGIPTARNVDHIGITVPDLEQALSFFVDVLGCEVIYHTIPFSEPEGELMEERLAVDRKSNLELAMVRCGPTTNVELLAYESTTDDEQTVANDDVGATHLAFYVDDLEAGIEYLDGVPDVEVQGSPTPVVEGPSAGLEFVYFTAPWGLQLELINYPDDLPFTEETEARPFGPAPAWDHRYE